MRDSTFSPDQPQYRVFKLFGDSLAGNPNQDYLDYLTYAVPQGAPFKVTEGGDTIPDMKGDQMCWSVFNDANPAQHTNDAGNTAPLGIEVKSTIFAYERTGSLGNIIFLKWRVFNKGSNTLRNCFFSVWDDPDLGGSGDDLIGCDTILSVGFDYNATNADQYYGATPPCYGIDFFQGPLRPRTPADSLLPDGKMWDTSYADSVNLGMVAFSKYINGTDPNSAGESYNNMLGLNKDGSPYIFNGDTLKFQVSGDPVAGTGDIDPSGNDKRMNETTGPITFRPGDSTEILAAIVVGQGGDRLSSVTVMKELAKYAKVIYINNFVTAAPPAKPVVTVAQLHDEISLSWTDTSEIDQGEFPFEGYTVWQAPTAAGPWTVLATYDLIDGLNDALIDTLFDPASGLNLPVVQRVIKNTGLQHSFTTTTDGILGGKLNDMTEYFFRVSAFSFSYVAKNGLRVPNGDRFLESQTTLTVIPQAPVAGLHTSINAHDTVAANHTSGITDGNVRPLVIDPKALTGDTYRVTFGIDTQIVNFVDTTLDSLHFDTLFTDTCSAVWNPDSHKVEIILCVDTTPFFAITPGVDSTFTTFWNLNDLTTGKQLLTRQFNLSGDNDYRVVDGLMVKVEGAPPGIKPDDANTTSDTTKWGWKIPAGTRRWTWSSGAGFGFEGFEGALGWVALNEVFSASTGKVPVTETQRVLLKLATVDSLGNFSTEDPNVSFGYRYGRNFGAAPAQPSFAAHMINTTGSGYAFQDFAPTVPFSAWNIEVDPPQRLTVGFLENNVTRGLVDGIYFPDPSDTLAKYNLDNTASAGPREFLFIFPNPYSETPDPDFQGDLLNSPNTPTMYWGTFNRRVTAVPYSPDSSGEDQFLIIPSRIILPADTFTFTAPAPTFTENNVDLSQIKAVPNPFYLFSSYDPNPGSYQLKFHHLPAICTITIYNLAGDLIRKIDKNDPSPIASWDLLTGNFLPVASGIYIYVVQAPGFGQFVGKVAIFVEEEVLKIY